MDVLLLDKYTNNIEYWNPFEEFKDIIFFSGMTEYYILGPLNIDNETYIWSFRINCISNIEIMLTTQQNSKNSDPCISISIKNDVGKINYDNECNKYRGKDLIQWGIAIIKHLGCNRCILNEQTEKNCSNHNFTSLIHKLRKNKTYYEEFDFVPYNKNNNNYRNNKSIELNSLIKELQEIRWDQYNIDHIKWREFYDMYGQYYPSPILAFKQFREDICAIFYDILYLLSVCEQPSYELLFKINYIISKSVWMKLL